MTSTIAATEPAVKFAPSDALWKQSEFGHPGNWREEVADFCIGAYLRVALSIQNAPWLPHAIEFSTLYDYKVTAKEERVEVWEDLLGEAMEHTDLGDTRLFRSHKRYMQKGESITVSGSIPQFVTDDLSLDGESIKRVRVSKAEGFYAVLTLRDERAEFVDLKQVDITCVPSHQYARFLEERYPNLKEIPWEEEA
jgi:hypothetical protein